MRLFERLSKRPSLTAICVSENMLDALITGWTTVSGQRTVEERTTNGMELLVPQHRYPFSSCLSNTF